MNMATIGDNSLISAYKPFREQLAELQEKNAAKSFNYEDPKDEKEARSHIHSLRRVKGDLERTRKAEKAESLELGKRIDAQAKAIEAEIDALIDVHAKPIEEIESREKERIERIKSGFAAIANLTTKADPFGGLHPSATLKANLATLDAIEFDGETYKESLPDAVRAKEDGATVLRAHIAEAEKREAEVAELAKLRQEKEERERRDREELIRQEAAETAREAAETAATAAAAAAAQRANDERLAALRREDQLKDEAAQSEKRRIAAEEQAARTAKETEDRIAREAAEKQRLEDAATAKREKDKKHRASINNTAKAALVAGGLSDAAATAAVTLIAQGKVPAITISY